MKGETSDIVSVKDMGAAMRVGVGRGGFGARDRAEEEDAAPAMALAIMAARRSK